MNERFSEKDSSREIKITNEIQIALMKRFRGKGGGRDEDGRWVARYAEPFRACIEEDSEIIGLWEKSPEEALSLLEVKLYGEEKRAA